jgi:biotin transporter BioY
MTSFEIDRRLDNVFCILAGLILGRGLGSTTAFRWALRPGGCGFPIFADVAGLVGTISAAIGSVGATGMFSAG